MGNTNQKVPKHPENRNEEKPPTDDSASFFSGMSVFLEQLAAQQNQLTKDTRKPVPKPRHNLKEQTQQSRAWRLFSKKLKTTMCKACWGDTES